MSALNTKSKSFESLGVANFITNTIKEGYRGYTRVKKGYIGVIWGYIREL